ncbi:hypothetical protein [Winogradskyella flava]|uniref:MG2 domain-containing protein n=1 Tax=Winogradskyella flava TaxID=1884876 RepID=A0A842IPI8_9FLAO|nr:hypothetical protein [Winogradskyella flava]MBC2843733.1 hypothetical protein [Winogradskyella flava]
MLGSIRSFAQLNNNEKHIAAHGLKNIPQESVFVHFNTSLLFVGEQFLYKIYCFNNESETFSNISKIAYIELIAQNESVVFKHKIRLDTGTGDGDFFIPTDLSTGTYKLFAYTQWMRNHGTASFFEADIAIINPYQKVPKDYLEKSMDTLVNKVVTGDIKHPESTSYNEDSEGLISLDKTELGKRKKLRITIDNKNINNVNYSLSVRQLNDIVNLEPELSVGFIERLKNSPKYSKNITPNLSFLPELRGELISGTVVNKENDSLVSGKRIALSFPGKNYLFKVSTTDDFGRFYFNLDAPYESSCSVLQHFSKDWKSDTIYFNKNQVQYEDLKFRSFKLNPSMKDYIEKRSIENQIENAYISLKLDRESTIKQNIPFYREFKTIYHLDDYTRFNTIEETIIEVVDEMSIKKTPQENRSFYIKPKIEYQYMGFTNLLFVDGVYVKDQEAFMDYNAKNIKTIRLSRDRYLIGSIPYQGIIAIETIDGDFYENFEADDIEKLDLFAPQDNKIYFKQDYQTDTNNEWDRIPDFRRQLLWIPNITLDNAQVIELYTSDIQGDYQINLEGFSSSGKPISASKTFRVHE